MTSRLVLASASPARLSVLQRAGIEPEVVVSGIDESQIVATDPQEFVLELARLKCAAVADGLPDRLVLGCDSVLVFGHAILGKPKTPEVARSRWLQMRGKAGVLHTGHCLRLGSREVLRAVATVVHFADIDDATIDAYVATGEPLEVAGAFTIDGRGGAFIERLEGDHLNVLGLSLPTVREMAGELGIAWPLLWNRDVN